MPTFYFPSPSVLVEKQIKTLPVPTGLTLFHQDAIVFMEAKFSTPKKC